jgi:hypothetical protein
MITVGTGLDRGLFDHLIGDTSSNSGDDSLNGERKAR